MNEDIIESYLDIVQEGTFVIQEDELEHMSEGLREFVGKINKASFKRMTDKLHRSFSNGDGDGFDSVAKETSKIGKVPKVKEISDLMTKAREDSPAFGASIDLAKKVVKNTFKIRDKAKLEIIGSIIGMTGWIKSKGGKTDPVRETKVTLQNINSQVNNVYDTGFENMEASTPEEEEMKAKMIDQSKQQEKKEMIVVGIVLSVLVSAIVWAGIAIFSFFTSWQFMGAAAALAAGTILLKVLMFMVAGTASIAAVVITFLKVSAAK
jgi:hypothetical protein